MSGPRFDRRAVLAGGLACLFAGKTLAAPSAPIVTWGDSLTFGTGASRIANRYPIVLGASFSPPREIYNGGVGGDTSSRIAERMLADENHRDWTAVIWAGRNDYQAKDLVLANIAAMVAHLSSRRFLVLSILNADVPEERSGGEGWLAISRLNRELSDVYAGHFLDIRRFLVEHGLASAGLLPTPADLDNIGNDVPPATLRADHVHLNDLGQAAVAHQVHDYLVAQNW